MLAAKDRPPQDAAVSSRPLTLAAPARITSNLHQYLQNTRPLFSYSYKMLLPQLPCFDIHVVCPGGGGTLPSVACALSLHFSAGTKIPTSLFSFASALFAARAKANPCISNHSRTLRALLCKSSSINSFVFMRPRTLWKNHPGGGTPSTTQLQPLRAILAPSTVGCERRNHNDRAGTNTKEELWILGKLYRS